MPLQARQPPGAAAPPPGRRRLCGRPSCWGCREKTGRPCGSAAAASSAGSGGSGGGKGLCACGGQTPCANMAGCMHECLGATKPRRGELRAPGLATRHQRAAHPAAACVLRGLNDQSPVGLLGCGDGRASAFLAGFVVGVARSSEPWRKACWRTLARCQPQLGAARNHVACHPACRRRPPAGSRQVPTHAQPSEAGLIQALSCQSRHYNVRQEVNAAAVSMQGSTAGLLIIILARRLFFRRIVVVCCTRRALLLLVCRLLLGIPLLQGKRGNAAQANNHSGFATMLWGAASMGRARRRPIRFPAAYLQSQLAASWHPTVAMDPIAAHLVHSRPLLVRRLLLCTQRLPLRAQRLQE